MGAGAALTRIAIDQHLILKRGAVVQHTDGALGECAGLVGAAGQVERPLEAQLAAGKVFERRLDHVADPHPQIRLGARVEARKQQVARGGGHTVHRGAEAQLAQQPTQLGVIRYTVCAFEGKDALHLLPLDLEKQPHHELAATVL